MKAKGLSKFYFLIGALFIIMLYVNSKYFKGSSNSHVGITIAKDFKITSEKSGIIKTIKVVPGQQVKAGELLVVMENTSLEIDIAKLSNKIRFLKKEKQEKAALVQSKIAYLRAESGIKLEELESEILQISSELELNEQLMNELTNSTTTEKTAQRKNNPRDLKISSLKQEKNLNNQATKIKIIDLVNTNQTEIMVLENEIILLEQELELFKKQKEQLTKYANFNGVVENVYVRPEEEIEAFTPIMTINPERPTFVTAYMVGARSMELKIGSKVIVRSYNSKKIETRGEVIGFGSIVPLPEILQKSTAVNAFGTEVFIQIPEENSFVKGEKVLIK